MSNGISNKSSKKTRKKKVAKKADKPVVEEKPEEDNEPIAATPKGVISDSNMLEGVVVAAKNKGLDKLLVTEGLLKELLGVNYKDDKMMIYKNMPIYDYNHVSDVERENAKTIEEKVFGRSTAKIGPQSTTHAGKANG